MAGASAPKRRKRASNPLDTLHIILSVAVLLGFFYANTISWKLDKANAELAVNVAANFAAADMYAKLSKEMDEITADYNVLADKMKEDAEESQRLINDSTATAARLLEDHVALTTDYKALAKELHTIKVSIAEMFPDLGKHLFKGDDVAELRASDRRKRSAEFEKGRKERQDAERQEKA